MQSKNLCTKKHEKIGQKHRKSIKSVDVCDERPSIQLLALIEARINLVIFCSSETSEPIVEQRFLEKERSPLGAGSDNVFQVVIHRCKLLR